ncbi:hypothetical protein LQG66_08675 [Bradyrhizobium ontarionense]|uniref:Uncharacterized protein n=1 Tax=Bradyrhizobium ontarionense TaxID=2898149 RepID=A0ABY3RFX3_9BRAD|nr:hypothetical protein [Bradyrhizobium sp. A19]UFZ06354.1 hypothetical protein LQG66_08675 [Bradyrhizobium sp. A19]
MADAKISLRPIVVPRAFDGQRIHFAVVFNFDLSGNAQDQEITFPEIFREWPKTLHNLKWRNANFAAGNPTVAEIEGGVFVDVKIAETRKSRPASRTDAVHLDASKALKAWSKIFSFENPNVDRSKHGRSVGQLASLFRQPQAPADPAVGAGPDQRVVTNPSGGSDLRPTRRIESLETRSTRAWLDQSAAHIQTVLQADPRQLAMVKAHVAARRPDFVRAANKVGPGQALELMAVSNALSLPAAPGALNLDPNNAQDTAMLKLAAAVSLSNIAAGGEAARVQRSVNLARNRPRQAMDPKHAEHPGVAEILARLKHHPGVMEQLGLVVHCSAPIDAVGDALVSGTISLRIPEFGSTVLAPPAEVVTHFELNPDTKNGFFRAQEKVENELDGHSTHWKRFNLLPRDYFSLQQEDHTRTLMRSLLTAGSPSTSPQAGPTDEALTDAIIIQSERPDDQRVAEVILNRLSRGQELIGAPTIELYAEDLMSGYAFDVAFDENGGAGKWHSLCRRRVRVYGDGESDPLIDCEEEGYVSTSVGTSAAPIVGPIQAIDTVTGADDKTTLQKFVLRVDQRGAYNSSVPDHSNGYLVTAQKAAGSIETSNSDVEPSTQLRSVLRDVTDISDLLANQGSLPAGAEMDRVQVTIGPMPSGAPELDPTLVQELFLSPVFATDALKDSELPQSRVQFFQARSKLRKEDFNFAFSGGISSFLNADGTVLAHETWPPKFEAFEAEGERRAYLRSATDLVAQRRLSRSIDPGKGTAVISDSLPQAVLTAEHAARSGGDLTLLTLPFVASKDVTRGGQKLQMPAIAVFPLRLRFSGQVDDISAVDTGDGRKSFNFRLTGIAADVPFTCAAEVIADRAGHAVELAKGDAVSGDGILQSLNAPLKILQLNFLGTKDSQSPGAKAAIAAPVVAWLPRIARIETELQRVRGPAKGQVAFEMRGQITPSTTSYKFPGETSARNGTLISWQPAGQTLIKTKLIVPSDVATPAKDEIVAASGKVVTVTVGAESEQQVFLIERWAVLAPADKANIDAAISDEARAAKSSSHLDWIVTISTDQGDQPVRFDVLAGPQDTTNKPLHQPSDISTALNKGDQIWLEAICVNEIGKLRGVGWPGWIAGFIAAKSTTLTTLDLRTIQVPSADPNDRAGYFKLVSSLGKVTLAAVDMLSPRTLRMMGELVSTEIVSTPNQPDTLVLHLASLTGKSQWQMQCRKDARFSDVESGLPNRRVADLLPGDCIVASAWPNGGGQLQIDLTDGSDGLGGKLVALEAGLFGKWTPASQADTSANIKRLSSIALSEGSIDFLPGVLRTPRGISRTVWGPRRYQDQSRAVAAENALASHDPIEGAALRYLPVAFARTIIEHAAQPAAAAAAGVAPIHAVASDCIARWRGWWLTVPQPGNTDLPEGKKSDGAWPITIKCTPPAAGMLPLRTKRGYWVRGWRVDLAGNMSQHLDTETRKHLASLTPASYAQKLSQFTRPDAPLAPVMAQPGKTLNLPQFSFVGYHQEEAADQAPGTSMQSLRLVLVTERNGKPVPPRSNGKGALYNSSCHLLPPPVDVETVIGTGFLDPDPKRNAAALLAHGKQVTEIIRKHEQFFDDGILAQRPSGLNYFPDPFATHAVASVTETLRGVVPASAVSSGAGWPGQWSNPVQLQLVQQDKWLDKVTPWFIPQDKWRNAAAPQLELATGPVGASASSQKLALRVPPARTAQCRIAAMHVLDLVPDALRKNPDVIAAVEANAGLTIDLTHAVTGPLRQPEWIQLVDDPSRVQNDTAQNFKSLLNVDVPSSGAMAFSMYWNDLWDETVPALFGPATVVAYAPTGKITKVEIKNPGFGYGSVAVVGKIHVGGDGAILQPVVKDGKLTAVTIEDGGNNYPKDRAFAITVNRRPPLHTPAVAEAKVVGGKVVEVRLKQGAEANGFYARPPLVVLHDMKGTGRKANYKAVIDREGRVTGFQPVKTRSALGQEDSGLGEDYSAAVIVGIYTDQAQIADQPIADRDNLDQPAWESRPFEFSHSFGDTRARRLYVIGDASTRFPDMVAEIDRQPMTTEPRILELVSSARPPKPEIAYLLPAYANRPLLKEPDRLIEQRDSVIRCYMHRPWNATGDERLGVVVYSAQINTSRIVEDVANEGLIPQGLRKYVSRWGFDPVWDEAKYSPLTIDDFTRAVDVARYDDVVELDGTELPPVSVALHEVKYSAKKDMWYADIAVRAPEEGMPFVQLALVRYQPHSVPRLSMSEVALADPIVHPGLRRLTVRRSSANAVKVALGGNFDGLRQPGTRSSNLPKRKVVVELRQRMEGLSLAFEGPLAHRDEQIDQRSVDRWELDRAADWKTFAGKVTLSAAVLRAPQDYYLAVKEFEVFPAGASYRDMTGSAGSAFNSGPSSSPVPAYDRLVFYRALGLQELPAG